MISMPEGISHIGLEVRDPARTARLFQTLFSAQIINKKPVDEFQPEMFIKFANTWFALIEGDGHKARSDDHIALTVPESDLEIYATRLSALGLEHRYSKRENQKDSSRSLYFYDYDNHFFELQTTSLEDELSVQIRAAAIDITSD